MPVRDLFTWLAASASLSEVIKQNATLEFFGLALSSKDSETLEQTAIKLYDSMLEIEPRKSRGAPCEIYALPLRGESAPGVAVVFSYPKGCVCRPPNERTCEVCLRLKAEATS